MYTQRLFGRDASAKMPITVNTKFQNSPHETPAGRDIHYQKLPFHRLRQYCWPQASPSMKAGRGHNKDIATFECFGAAFACKGECKTVF
jgi:hypothetical protein